MKLFAAILVLILSATTPTPTTSFRVERRDTKSLYSDKDHVVEFDPANLTSTVYSSQQIWVVEFYAHWCGHCQKFAKVWKKIAEEFAGELSFKAGVNTKSDNFLDCQYFRSN